MTLPVIDHSHDPAAQSWMSSANGHPEFPVQNLPFGVFSVRGGEARGGVAIGDRVLDLAAIVRHQLLEGDAKLAAQAASVPPLNRFFGLPPSVRRALRHALFDMLCVGARPLPDDCLHDMADCAMLLPFDIGDYTDFYAGIRHAENVGRLMRPDNPLMPNYKHVPIGYHGRASSIRPSGTDVRRPRGQVKPPEHDLPHFQPSARLDYEVELGIWIGSGNELGTPIPIAAAHDHIAGLSLLNDWSARDIQAWEYQPLGPFLAKNFASTVSPWVVTAEALAPFHAAQQPRAADDPTPLPYLLDPADQAAGAYAIDIEVALQTSAMAAAGLAPVCLGRTNALHLYWTPAQFIAHHSSNGCNLSTGDLLGTGTISAPDSTGYGSLMEITHGGKEPLTLPNGEVRHFLEDGDTVILTGRARADGRASIGFGECRATILPVC